MAKQTFYFPHDGNARNDDRIIAVRMRHKMEGYGVYFAILERLLESSDYMSIKDYNVIAFDLHVGSDLVKSIVEDFGLFSFTDDSKYFYSNSFNDRMKPLENIREQRRLAGRKSAEKRAKTNDSSTTVQRPLTQKATEESRVEESKEDITKDKENSTIVELKKADAAKAATLKRRDNFYRTLIPFIDKYSKDLVRAFFDYWSELNKSETKMRFELQNTWEVDRRLSTWAKREKFDEQSTNQISRGGNYSGGKSSNDKAASRSNLESLADSILEQYST